jgi:acetoin utilization deacetylase AcuC-like enzyme
LIARDKDIGKDPDGYPIVEKHISVLEWLLPDPYSIEIISHMWTVQPFTWSKKDLMRVHKDRTMEEMSHVLNRFVEVQLLIVTEPPPEANVDYEGAEPYYKFNIEGQIGKAFNNFMNLLCINNLDNMIARAGVGQ